MTLVEWKDEYKIGIKVVDEHHRHLVNLINKSYGAVRLNNMHTIGFILGELDQYARYHFNTEETLMQKHGFPSLVMHKKAHGTFCERVEELQSKLNAGEALYNIRIVVFLKDWLINHILATDKELAVYLCGKGIE